MLKNKNFLHIIAVCLLVLIQVSESQSQKSIKVGKPITIKEVPHLVQVWFEDEFLCTGTLISKHYAVAAASCVFFYDELSIPNELFVTAGASKVSPKLRARSQVVELSIPRNFSGITFNMDVAVLKLKEPLEGSNIKPIKLCSKPIKTGTNLKVSGWFTHAGNIEMRTVNVTKENKYECSPLNEVNPKLTYSLFCASAPKNNNDCISGSDAVAVVNGEFCGFVSTNMGCESKNISGSYTDVYKIRKFITGVLKK